MGLRRRRVRLMEGRSEEDGEERRLGTLSVLV